MRLRAATVLLALATGAVVTPGAGAKGPEVFPLSKVRAGQKGYGLTVFQGTTPERFGFEVIGVARNFLPKLDIILVRSDDPKLAVTGFAHGMSGSPLFIDGKIACAFAYAWRFNKQAIGGCTPIEYMLEEVGRPLRGRERTAIASADEWRRYDPLTLLARRDDGPHDREAWLARAPLPTAPAAPAGDGPTLVRAGVPLAVSGLTPSAFEQARKLFEPYGLETMQGAGSAGTASAAEGPRRFELGGSLAVRLITGDVEAAATGTVSWVDGKRVVAFGHPLFGMGELYLPVTGAWVHTIIPSAQAAFKLASATRTLGSLVQDRPSGIVADTSLKADLIPIDIKIRRYDGVHAFRTRVIRHRFLTPQLATLAVTSAVQSMSPDVTDVTLTVRSTLRLKGHEPLRFTDYLYSTEGVSPNAIASARALRVLVPLLFNPFEPIRIERFDLEAEVAYKADFARIDALRLPSLELPFDEDTWVDVVLEPYDGREYVQRIPLRIPRHLAGATVKIEIVPGDAASPDGAEPDSLAEVIRLLRTETFPANMLVATVYTPDEGVALRGQVLADLPDSALDTARPAAATRRADAYRSLLRAKVPLRQVATGRQELVVKIAEPK